MAVERTLMIVKPDAVQRRLIGEVVRRFEKEGMSVRQMQMRHLDRAEAEAFYAEHAGKPFFETLVQYMTSGACVVTVLEGESAISRARALMGATNPAMAEPATIRGDYGLDNTRNSVHGSDSPASAAREIGFFFPDDLPA
jgi:nucleoside-diphosphate kinase